MITIIVTGRVASGKTTLIRKKFKNVYEMDRKDLLRLHPVDGAVNNRNVLIEGWKFTKKSLQGTVSHAEKLSIKRLIIETQNLY